MTSASQRPPWEAMLAIGLVSFCVLGYEVALTRVFSVLFHAGYVFLIVSGAVGGLGLGALAASMVRPREDRLGSWLGVLCLAFAVALVAPTVVLFVTPWGRALVAEAETTLVVAVPLMSYAVAGMLLALLFRRFGSHGGLLYFVDLGAAALAAPVTVLLLDTIGGFNTPLVLATLAAAAAAALAARSRSLTTAGGAVLVFAGSILLWGSNLRREWISMPAFSPVPGAESRRANVKPLFVELGDPSSGARILRTDWSAFARTDVVSLAGRETLYVYTDGGVPTQMSPFDGDPKSVAGVLTAFPGNLPYRVLQPRRVLAIGSGAGLDAILAVAHGAEHVDAVEVNPSIPRLLALPDYRRYYIQVYHDPAVRLVTDEGRSFLDRAGSYDLIYFGLAMTATTQTRGVALVDNFLYTVEAFREYWRHLSPDGSLALVVQSSSLADRLFCTALRALEEEDVPAGSGLDHLLHAQVPSLGGEDKRPYRVTILLRKKAWTAAEASGLETAIAENRMVPIFVPYGSAAGAYAEARSAPTAAALGRVLAMPYRLADGGRLDLSPVTDDQPFYADLSPGLHPQVRTLLIFASGALVLYASAFLWWLGSAARRSTRIGAGGSEGGVADPGGPASTDAGADGADGAAAVASGSEERPLPTAGAGGSEGGGANPDRLSFTGTGAGGERGATRPSESPVMTAASDGSDASAGRSEPGASRVRVSTAPLACVAYFGALGVGFMLVEVSLLQRLNLLLGFPTRSLTVILCTLLLGGAAGSLFAQRGDADDAARRLTVAVPLLLVLLVFLRLGLPTMVYALLPHPLWQRVLGAVAVLAPTGFLLGIPFPTGMRLLARSHAAAIAPVWGLNGVASILGSVLTMAIAKLSGYGDALLVAAGCYLLALLAGAGLRRSARRAG